MIFFDKFDILPLSTITVPPYTTTNTVAYGQENFVIIDPATKNQEHQDLLVKYISNRLNKKQKFLAILLTHHHADHVGFAETLSQSFGVAIYAHPLAAQHLSFTIDKKLVDGEIITLDNNTSLRVIFTPGHAESHVVFYDNQEQCLIAGDMITDRGTILIPPISGNLKIYLDSLSSLSYLSLKIIIPAHGLAITKEPNNFLLTAIKHRLSRIESIYQILKLDSYLDPTEITQAVYGDSFDHNILPFAQLSVESSLQWLLEMGLAEQAKHRWRLRHASP